MPVRFIVVPTAAAYAVDFAAVDFAPEEGVQRQTYRRPGWQGALLFAREEDAQAWADYMTSRAEEAPCPRPSVTSLWTPYVPVDGPQGSAQGAVLLARLLHGVEMLTTSPYRTRKDAWDACSRLNDACSRLNDAEGGEVGCTYRVLSHEGLHGVQTRTEEGVWQPYNIPSWLGMLTFASRTFADRYVTWLNSGTAEPPPVTTLWSVTRLDVGFTLSRLTVDGPETAGRYAGEEDALAACRRKNEGAYWQVGSGAIYPSLGRHGRGSQVFIRQEDNTFNYLRLDGWVSTFAAVTEHDARVVAAWMNDRPAVGGSPMPPVTTLWGVAKQPEGRKYLLSVQRLRSGKPEIRCVYGTLEAAHEGAMRAQAGKEEPTFERTFTWRRAGVEGQTLDVWHVYHTGADGQDYDYVPVGWRDPIMFSTLANAQAAAAALTTAWNNNEAVQWPSDLTSMWGVGGGYIQPPCYRIVDGRQCASGSFPDAESAQRAADLWNSRQAAEDIEPSTEDLFRQAAVHARAVKKARKALKKAIKALKEVG